MLIPGSRFLIIDFMIWEVVHGRWELLRWLYLFTFVDSRDVNFTILSGFFIKVSWRTQGEGVCLYRSVMSYDFLGCARYIGAQIYRLRKCCHNRLPGSYSLLLFVVLQKECLVGFRLKRVPIEFLTFVHTARRSYRCLLMTLSNSVIWNRLVQLDGLVLMCR